MQAEAAFRRDGCEFRWLEDEWIKLLEPLRWHIDIAPALAIHYLRADHLVNAAETLADVAGGRELGWWNDIYLTGLEAIAKERLRSLPEQPKFATLNAYGMCLTRSGRFEDAIRIFRRLRSAAKRAGDSYWVGQSLINQGVAKFSADDVAAAINLYDQAKEHGERTHDRALIGRCLGNLAESFRDTDPAKSRELLTRGSWCHPCFATIRRGDSPSIVNGERIGLGITALPAVFHEPVVDPRRHAHRGASFGGNSHAAWADLCEAPGVDSLA